MRCSACTEPVHGLDRTGSRPYLQRDPERALLPLENQSGPVERALDLLELLAKRDEVSLADAAAGLGSSRATAFRILSKLQSRGYVEHVRAQHTYRLGPQVRELASWVEQSALTRLALPFLSKLRTESGESANLAAVRRNRIVYEMVLDGEHSLRISANVGEEVPPHSTALGKAILAWTEPVRRPTLLGRASYGSFTTRTITTEKKLKKELDRVRTRGYAIDDEEMSIGAYCVAAPIIGSSGDPIGAISVSGLAARIPVRARAALGESVKRYCEQISLQLAPKGVAGRTRP